VLAPEPRAALSRSLGIFMPEASQELDGSVTVELGSKGDIELDVIVSAEKWGRGPAHDVHSSRAANVDAPAWHLVQGLNTLVDAKGDPAVDGFFAIMDKWRVSTEKAGDLLGGMPRSSVYKLKTAAGTLRQDELTRISYIVGIYKALHILLPDTLADQWISQANENILFGGQTPLEYIVKAGIPGLHQVRSLLDAARGGR